MNAINRLDARLTTLSLQGKKAFVAYFTAGYPELDLYADVLGGLPAAGVDIIEVGMPFNDPMADGPAIQSANIRALNNGVNSNKIFEYVRAFREKDDETPLILMGYYNPIYSYGVKKFLDDAEKAGVDAFIIPDLPPEEDAEFREPAAKRGIKLIRFLTPTSDDARLKTILEGAEGFLYYVSITGITGSKQADPSAMQGHIAHIKEQTDLPVFVGFGVSTPEQARAVASVADGVIVGSAFINRMVAHFDAEGHPDGQAVTDTLALASDLSQAVKG